MTISSLHHPLCHAANWTCERYDSGSIILLYLDSLAGVIGAVSLLLTKEQLTVAGSVRSPALGIQEVVGGGKQRAFPGAGLPGIQGVMDGGGKLLSGAMAFHNVTLDARDERNLNNQSSCDVFVYQRAAVVLFPVFYTLLFFISVCGNTLVLYVTCRRKQKFNSTSIYLVNLALSDILFTLALPGRITYYIRHFDWPFGDLLCRITTLLFFANTYAGIAFMTCLSLDRYLAMVHPHWLQSLRSVKVVRRVCCLVWTLVLLEITPLLFQSMLRDHKDRHTCMEYFNFDGSRSTPYLLLLACSVSFCGPVTVILLCYYRINLKLRAATKQNNLNGRFRRNNRVNTVIFLILLTFIICFSPYHLNLMQFMLRKIHHQPTCQELRSFKVSLQVTVSLMNFNCCVDPVIYFFAIKTYRQRVLSLFKGYLLTTRVSSKSTTENSSSNT
ncbi:G-protein coupled receptor 183 [Lampris incognitus]|uniref:G-protein coupled receptor 183 n=1 Tax=Lampris incognitus TaxID=2546036 RepID=UPI0024B48799|nr:G-protein coupled receptor 183 [Lampris incognitus]